MEGYKFRCEIIDEAQYIKNANTQASESSKRGSGRLQAGSLQELRWKNRLSELWSIFDYLMPGFFTAIEVPGRS